MDLKLIVSVKTYLSEEEIRKKYSTEEEAENYINLMNTSLHPYEKEDRIKIVTINSNTFEACYVGGEEDEIIFLL